MMDDSSDDESRKLADKPTSCSAYIWQFFNTPKKCLITGGTFLAAIGSIVATTPWFLKIGFAVTLAPAVVSKILFAGFFIAAVGVAMIAAGLIYDYYQSTQKTPPFVSQPPERNQYAGGGNAWKTEDNEHTP